MIVAVGIDVVLVDRFVRALERTPLLSERLFAGRPGLPVSGTVAAAATERGVSRWHLSLSHDGGIASAMVVAERDAKP